MTLLQFTPLQSRPSPNFWHSLSTLKLDTLRLDDTPQPLVGFLTEASGITDRSGVDGKQVWLGGALGVDERSLGDRYTTLGMNEKEVELKGMFKNFNTVEEFRKVEGKKELFNSVVDQLIESFRDEPKTFNPFLLVSWADLKKYTYGYWFAFPALVEKPGWEVVVDDDDNIAARVGSTEDTKEIRQLKGEAQITSEAFLYKVVDGKAQVGHVHSWSTFFSDVPEDQRTVVFHDPTSNPEFPGWPLRNVLYYLARFHSVQRTRVICLRGDKAASYHVSLPSKVATTSSSTSANEKPVAVGWEKNLKGQLTSRVVDLGASMDPTRLADQAVDLNLKLMKWRVMPDLELDKISGTRCLLLGAGTLGCYVARALMGWGVRNITFVDSGKVSFSNPVRQPLFEFNDCLEGGKPKAQCAADSLKRIFPGINAKGIEMMIPMPGHPVSPSSIDSVKDLVGQLEGLIDSHDVVYLLMDSRESRWLPTVLSAAREKIVINAALGFDSYLVMRHGAGPGGKDRLGCYYCNDIVAPMDSLTERTLDQMCTVTRPGVAPMASATAVELMVSLIQHPQGINAPADLAPGQSKRAEGEAEAEGSPLGLVPHQLRGFLAQFRTMLIEGTAYDRCTGCSSKVIEAYKEQGFEMLLKAFNQVDYLEKLTGLDKLYEQGEAALENVDWDESDEDAGSV